MGCVLSLASIALAYQSESATRLARALHGIAGADDSLRRDLAGDLQSAQATALGLAQAAGQAVAEGGQCSSECTDWVTTMGGCLTASSTTKSAQCVCAGTAVTQMGNCGSCLGGDNAQGASSLSNLCSQYASEIDGASSGALASATASASDAGASSTAASEASDASSVALTSSAAASASESAASEGGSASSAEPTTSSATTTGDAPKETHPSSGAAKVSAGGAALALAAFGAVYVL
ncbi:hypothetical protein JCM8202v2_002679 [Rhodotorula sphaerocarpa]